MIFLPFLDNLPIIGKLIVTYIWTMHDWISLIYIVYKQFGLQPDIIT